jgi:hypothetical protein
MRETRFDYCSRLGIARQDSLSAAGSDPRGEIRPAVGEDGGRQLGFADPSIAGGDYLRQHDAAVAKPRRHFGAQARPGLEGVGQPGWVSVPPGPLTRRVPEVVVVLDVPQARLNALRMGRVSQKVLDLSVVDPDSLLPLGADVDLVEPPKSRPPPIPDPFPPPLDVRSARHSAA